MHRSDCNNCGNNLNETSLYDNNTEEVVCTACGVIVNNVNIGVVPDSTGYLCTRTNVIPRYVIVADGHMDDVTNILHATKLLYASPMYKRKNHFNQILLAWARLSKPIPKDLIEQVITWAGQKRKNLCRYRSRRNRLFKKKVVLQLLKNNKLNKDLAEKYRSKKYKKRQLTKLSDRKQYSMNWWRISDCLEREFNPQFKIDIPPPDLVTIMQHIYHELTDDTFDKIRHVTNCKCTKKERDKRCRYSMLNTNYMARKILEMINIPQYIKAHAKDFPPLSKAKTHKLDTWFNMMLKEKGWYRGDTFRVWLLSKYGYFIKRVSIIT